MARGAVYAMAKGWTVAAEHVYADEGIPSGGQDLEARLRQLGVEIWNLTDAVAKGALRSPRFRPRSGRGSGSEPRSRRSRSLRNWLRVGGGPGELGVGREAGFVVVCSCLVVREAYWPAPLYGPLPSSRHACHRVATCFTNSWR